MTLVIGLDPGLATFGACVLSLAASEVVGASVFHSAPTKKRDVPASEDRYWRARELAAWLDVALEQWAPSVLAVEAMSFPRSGIAIASMGLAWGCLATTAARRGLRVVQVRPQDWKRYISGRKGVADDDLYPMLYERGGAEVQADLDAQGVPRSQHVHALDALGVALWSETTEVVRAGMAAVRETE